jgi:hypothetical protein
MTKQLSNKNLIFFFRLAFLPLPRLSFLEPQQVRHSVMSILSDFVCIAPSMVFFLTAENHPLGVIKQSVARFFLVQQTGKHGEMTAKYTKWL